MASRMERYQDISASEKTKSRTQKHKDLYDGFYTKPIYTEIDATAEVESDDRGVDLSQMKLERTTRESYHKVKEIEDFLGPSTTPKRASDLSSFFQEEVPKIYDINTVLESAKKNREEVDDLERRRKLKNTDYKLSEELLKKTTENDNVTKASDEEESLEELIHTITTRPLSQKGKPEEEKDLLSDLMPNKLNETIISEDLSKEILDKEEPASPTDKTGEIDHSFYTRSMDLSDTDFDEPATDEFVEKTHPFATFLKVFIAVILVLGIAVAAFYLMNKL